MFVLVWEFRHKPEREADFLTLYGVRGGWAALFARAPEFLGTELLRDARDAGRYVTIDRWTSRDAFDTFRSRWASEYAALDRAGEELTAHEARLGEFESPPGAD